MKSLDIINKLANKLEFKLQKYSQAVTEVESTDVTLSVRPVVNNILSQVKLDAALSKLIQDAANKAAENDQEIHGSLIINTYVTNAVLVDGRWKINPSTSGLKASGSLLNDKIIGPMIRQSISKVNTVIAQALEKEFNRLASNWAGSKINNHETAVDEINIEL